MVQPLWGSKRGKKPDTEGCSVDEDRFGFVLEGEEGFRRTGEKKKDKLVGWGRSQRKTHRQEQTQARDVFEAN